MTAGVDLHPPGTPPYASATSVWGRSAPPAAPAAVARPRDLTELGRAVRFAAAEGLDVAIRGAGHHLAGGSCATTGLVVDMREFRALDRTPEGAWRVGAGATWAEVNGAAAGRGEFVPAGNEPSTGVVGVALGGGIGPLSRSWGLTCDRVRAVGLLDAEGVEHRVDDRTDPGLLAVLRGAGRGAGVVTYLELDPQPVSPAVATVQAVLDGADAPDLVARWYAAAQHSDARVNPQLVLRRLPAAPSMTTDLRGRWVVIVGAVFAGETADAGPHLAPLRALGGTVLLDDSGDVPPAEPGRAWRPGLVARTTAHFLAAPTPAALAALVDLAAEAPPGASVTVRALGGAIRDGGAGASVFPHRRAELLVVAQSETVDPDAAAADADEEWCARADAVLDGLGSTGVYGNFVRDLALFADLRERAYGDTGPIDAVLRRVDPDGVFAGAAVRP